MSMSAPFDPEQQGSDVPVDGSDQDELEVERDRGDLTGSAEPTDAEGSPVRQHDEDEAGGGPVFRRPQAGDRLDAEELTADSELDS
ncbi:hypothetical protein [Curtobacterium sp. Leaf183]|uniref:hypothetical protein n=1 Tax=Curtobacterium sp. Leaf183 TaxID=1736291 RepID=UPI0012E79EC1|nr:hypothetical protein [Curtobacterium sp. Leaf183]